MTTGGLPHGHTALLVGGTTGIGRGVLEGLLAMGSNIVVVGRDSKRLARVLHDVDPAGERTCAVVADISDAGEARRAVEEGISKHGRLDALCLNAGIYPGARLAEITVEHLDQVLRTNLYATVLMTQAAAPALAESSCGRIVVTSSITGPITGHPGWSVYGASKAAQLGFIRTAAIELAEQDITINAVLPGKIEVETTASQPPSYRAAALAAIPLRRIGAPADIAAMVGFLCSPAAGFITGQTIVIDGGQTLPEVAVGTA